MRVSNGNESILSVLDTEVLTWSILWSEVCESERRPVICATSSASRSFICSGVSVTAATPAASASSAAGLAADAPCAVAASELPLAFVFNVLLGRGFGLGGTRGLERAAGFGAF